MVKITNGIQQPLAAIALTHWNLLNKYSPKLKRYHVNALVSNLHRLKAEHIISGEINRAIFYGYLLADQHRRLKELILCQPADLPALIDHIERLLVKLGLNPVTGEAENFGFELINRAFMYKNWRDGQDCRAIYRQLGIQVCPYCNLINIFEDAQRNLLIANYDHFYDKGRYPYLALSFYNLVPGCQTCNLTYKHTRPFSVETHLHPYLDNYNEWNTFDSDYKPGGKSYPIIIVTGQSQRSVKFNSDLGLGTRYDIDNIRLIAKQVYQIGQHYPPSKKKEMLKDFNYQPELVEQQICDDETIPFQPVEILNFQYGKLKRDLAFKNQIISPDNVLL